MDSSKWILSEIVQIEYSQLLAFACGFLLKARDGFLRTHARSKEALMHGCLIYRIVVPKKKTPEQSDFLSEETSIYCTDNTLLSHSQVSFAEATDGKAGPQLWSGPRVSSTAF